MDVDEDEYWKCPKCKGVKPAQCYVCQGTGKRNWSPLSHFNVPTDRGNAPTSGKLVPGKSRRLNVKTMEPLMLAFPREKSDAEFCAFFKHLKPNSYNVSITKMMDPMMSPEGGFYFSYGDHNFVVWPQEPRPQKLKG